MEKVVTDKLNDLADEKLLAGDHKLAQLLYEAGEELERAFDVIEQVETKAARKWIKRNSYKFKSQAALAMNEFQRMLYDAKTFSLNKSTVEISELRKHMGLNKTKEANHWMTFFMRELGFTRCSIVFKRNKVI